jgi:hypothetical protein
LQQRADRKKRAQRRELSRKMTVQALKDGAEVANATAAATQKFQLQKLQQAVKATMDSKSRASSLRDLVAAMQSQQATPKGGFARHQTMAMGGGGVTSASAILKTARQTTGASAGRLSKFRFGSMEPGLAKSAVAALSSGAATPSSRPPVTPSTMRAGSGTVPATPGMQNLVSHLNRRVQTIEQLIEQVSAKWSADVARSQAALHASSALVRQPSTGNTTSSHELTSSELGPTPSRVLEFCNKLSHTLMAGLSPVQVVAVTALPGGVALASNSPLSREFAWDPDGRTVSLVSECLGHPADAVPVLLHALAHARSGCLDARQTAFHDAYKHVFRAYNAAMFRSQDHSQAAL